MGSSTTAPRVGYALRDEYADTYLGGVLAVGDRSLDVGAELDRGRGTLYVDASDGVALVVLDNYPPLERVAEVPAGVNTTATVADLKAKASALGLSGYSSATREQLTAAIAAYNVVTERGDDEPEGGYSVADLATLDLAAGSGATE